MTSKKIFILVGHPDTESLVSSLALSYAEGAQAGGHEVRHMNIGEMHFDPILHKGYKEIQALEPDLLKAQENFKWADHIIILYPNWWCSMPAILKGMFDRMWLPGFAFNFKKDKDGNRTSKLIKMFEGKSARVVVTTGTHPLMIRFHFGDYTNEIIRGILGFSGIHPVRLSTFGPSEKASDAEKDSWRDAMHRLGRKSK
ncbi:MAG: NAD(P)H-dependent oxidoreductase [Candidatus Paceibacterota bacterium]